MGRVKREIKKIVNATRRQATFSKRRNGLFKKANELSVLCDAEVGLIVYNTAGKLFEFSSTSMKMLINKYLRHQESLQSHTFAELQGQEDNVEIEKLKEDISNLCHLCRGDIQKGFNLKMFDELEETLEMALKCIQKKQREIFTEQMNSLQAQEHMALRESTQLQKRLEDYSKEAMSRQYKYFDNYGTSSNCTHKFSNITNKDDFNPYETSLSLRL